MDKWQQALNDLEDGDFNETAIGTAKEAINLRVEKHVLDITHEDIVWGKCPTCFKTVLRYLNFNMCKCGQKLNWEEM